MFLYFKNKRILNFKNSCLTKYFIIVTYYNLNISQYVPYEKRKKFLINEHKLTTDEIKNELNKFTR